MPLFKAFVLSVIWNPWMRLFLKKKGHSFFMPWNVCVMLNECSEVSCAMQKFLLHNSQASCPNFKDFPNEYRDENFRIRSLKSFWNICTNLEARAIFFKSNRGFYKSNYELYSFKYELYHPSSVWRLISGGLILGCIVFLFGNIEPMIFSVNARDVKLP